jgi:hypothetical protein
MMKRLCLLVFALVLMLSSCATTGEVTITNGFRLSKDTAIAVQSPQDDDWGSSIENKLLQLGYKVVPYETALSDQIIEKAESKNNTTASVNESATTTNHIPKTIVIRVNLSFHHYPAATYFLGGNIRIVDLADQRLLANFSYPGSEFTLGNPNDIIKLFIEDFAQQIKLQ